MLIIILGNGGDRGFRAHPVIPELRSRNRDHTATASAVVEVALARLEAEEMDEEREDRENPKPWTRGMRRLTLVGERDDRRAGQYPTATK